ncbi:MAG: aldose 1-epimerase family protein [bacterium]
MTRLAGQLGLDQAGGDFGGVALGYPELPQRLDDKPVQAFWRDLHRRALVLPSAIAVTPSGEQWTLRFGDQQAVVVEVGGGLRSYEAAGRPVLDGYAVDEMCSGGRGQVLVPWPNRLGDGRYTFAGRTLQLPLSEPARRNAIHGLVRWLPWQLKDRDPTHVTVTLTLRPQPGYPFHLRVEVDYSLSDDGLRVVVSATNVGPDALPYAAGHHPYLTLGENLVDTASIELAASKVIEVDERGLPVRLMDVEATDLDFRRRRTIGPTALDTAFGGLERDQAGRAWLRMQSRDGQQQVGLWMEPAYEFVMLYTGDHLEDPARRRRGLAVEPMTAPPNALASGDGLITLGPSQSHMSAWGITVA